MNQDEKLFYAVQLLRNVRGDWSSSKQVRRWIHEAKALLPSKFSDYITSDYIDNACEDGRTTRDCFPTYYDIEKDINFVNLTDKFKEDMKEEFQNIEFL